MTIKKEYYNIKAKKIIKEFAKRNIEGYYFPLDKYLGTAWGVIRGMDARK